MRLDRLLINAPGWLPVVGVGLSVATTIIEPPHAADCAALAVAQNRCIARTQTNQRNAGF
jgi:hypothetical protein